MEVTLPRPELHSGNAPLAACDSFLRRHLGGGDADEKRMLEVLSQPSLEAFVDAVVPSHIRTKRPLKLPAALGERAALEELASIAARNRVCKSFIGQGYYGCTTPPVIQRNILENPGWYTAYTPYQAEIAQGRLEALANFQTMIADLTGLEIANASLLDEGTAAAEAVAMAHAATNEESASVIFADANCHPQTLEVLRTRVEVLGWKLHIQPAEHFTPLPGLFAVVVQVPDTLGVIRDFRAFAERMRAAGAVVIAIADPLALTLIEPPGEWGADIAVGSTQRFGVPMGFGGPHAAFIATRNAYKRLLPGRLVGLSKDAQGFPAYRLALQTREQHIRRDKATSNICTAQVLLAVMASMYAVYHGPTGLKNIATRVHKLTRVLQTELSRAGFQVSAESFFDTLHVPLAADARDGWIFRAKEKNMLLRSLPNGVGISLDETTTLTDVETLLQTALPDFNFETRRNAEKIASEPDLIHCRKSSFLTHPVFFSHHSETQMLRYIRSLEAKDLSLVHSMIPLGSCTMKLNATSEMLPVSWPQFSQIHPFAPAEHAEGYAILCEQLSGWLAEITGFAGVSLQPNAGSQGEYAGLLVIRAYHRSRGESQRTVCLIPTSAHGTNPASAVMVGMRVVTIKCGSNGDVDLVDLRAKAVEHREHLAALMVTYPSTHGVFEKDIREICSCVHELGGQVYMDGANLNAQVGICRPAELGVDVCHLNLHKTFCIPHGGGGPGVGPIAVASHLVPFLPAETVGGSREGKSIGSIAAAPQGSAGILPIPWMYLRMMGSEGLRHATVRALLHANYVARRLGDYFPILYTGTGGWVAHECILDLRAFKCSTAEDVAKRLMDYGFHAPTLSWPVAGTLMVEPTESESLAELDRFCEAMISIHSEMMAVENGEMHRQNNPLKNAPHPATLVCADEWNRPYSREIAAFPVKRLRNQKWWPVVGRIDNVWGDRNLFCTCAPMESEGKSARG